MNEDFLTKNKNPKRVIHVVSPMQILQSDSCLHWLAECRIAHVLFQKKTKKKNKKIKFYGGKRTEINYNRCRFNKKKIQC